MEALYNFKIEIQKENEDKVVVGVLAHTPYHAIEKAVTKFREYQPDRTKYKVLKNILSLS